MTEKSLAAQLAERINGGDFDDPKWYTPKQRLLWEDHAKYLRSIFLADIRAVVEPLAAEYEEEDEDFNPYEQSGGNFDDAYRLGEDAGETAFAARILGMIDKV
jgi:hypothetical protein